MLKVAGYITERYLHGPTANASRFPSPVFWVSCTGEIQQEGINGDWQGQWASPNQNLKAAEIQMDSQGNEECRKGDKKSLSMKERRWVIQE